MAWRPDYCSAADLKAHLRITDSADDAELAINITAASRAIDHACGRQFGSEVQTRLYAACTDVDGRPAVSIDDIMSTAGLTIKLDTARDGSYATTLTVGTDVDLWPYNAASEGEPWTVVVFREGAPALPTGRPRELQVAGTFGWTTVPTIVKQACLIQAARFFIRRDSLYGVSGSPETGTEMRLLERLDPDVAVTLAPVRRWWGAV